MSETESKPQPQPQPRPQPQPIVVPLTVPEVRVLLETMLTTLRVTGEVEFNVHNEYQVASVSRVGTNKLVLRFLSGESFMLTLARC